MSANVKGTSDLAEHFLDDCSGSAQIRQTAPSEGASFLTTVCNIVTCTLGAGVLSLPWSGAGTSLVVLVPTCAVALVINAWASNIVIDAADTLQIFDLGALLGAISPPLER